MARYIDAEALIEQMEADAEHIDNDIVQMMLYASINDVKNAPTADVVERKRGEWIDETVPTIDNLHTYHQVLCSACGERFISKVNFCPNCGADMRWE